MTITNHDRIKQIVPLWYANQAWAKELLTKSFGLSEPGDIVQARNRIHQQIPGTVWNIRPHGIGVDIFKSPDVGGIDFDFDKPDPDSWRLKIFFHRLLNDGQIPYLEYKELADDEELLERVINDVLAGSA